MNPTISASAIVRYVDPRRRSRRACGRRDRGRAHGRDRGARDRASSAVPFNGLYIHARRISQVFTAWVSSTYASSVSTSSGQYSGGSA